MDLLKLIPKTIKIGKKNLKYRLHFTRTKIPQINKGIKKDEIGIWYETKTPTNGRNIHYVILPKFINEDKTLYESIGLYFAEGSLVHYQSFGFSNDEPKIINTFMECFKSHFKVPFSSWSWSICFNDKLKKYENKNETEKREIASINFWLKKTKIKPESVSKTPCHYSNKNSKGKLNTKKKWGSLNIVYGNKILKNLWLKIMESLTKKVLKEKDIKNAALILRGWVAGDGYCRYQIYDKPKRELGVTSGDKKKIKIIYELFEILGIKPSLNKKHLNFVKAEYLVKAYIHKLTSLHPLKYLNLLKSLSSYKRIPISIKRLNLRKIKKEINQVEKEIKARERLFEKLKNGKIPKLKENIDWQFLINGLMLKEGGNYEKLKREIDCPKTVLINWLKRKIEPSRKYKLKLLEKIKHCEKKLIELGEFFLKGNWPLLFEGLQIFLKISRKELAKQLGVHVNTIESIINQRKKIGKNVASKVLNLLERSGKTPKEIIKIHRKSENLNWSNEVKRILRENEWPQRELAERLDCSRSLVREWLRGLEPSNKYKGKLLEFLKYQKNKI